MNKVLLSVIALAAACVALPVAAQPYVGAGFGVSDTDTQHTSVKIYAGVQIIPNFGFEFGYTDLGGYRGASASALALAITGTLPLGDTWDLIGKWGASQNHTNFSSSNNTDSMLSFGVGYNSSKTVAVRFEYENFGKLPTDPDGTSTLASSKALTVKYSF